MKRLNLKPHVCGGDPKRTKILCSAADIEGHLGLDGKVRVGVVCSFAFVNMFFFFFQFYLLDFSRTMPPVRPDKRFYNGHLYRLFRREFVASYPKPLCSDAYSGFITHDPKMVSGVI